MDIHERIQRYSDYFKEVSRDLTSIMESYNNGVIDDKILADILSDLEDGIHSKLIEFQMFIYILMKGEED